MGSDLVDFTPRVSEVGIEELGLSFPVKAYEGHYTERGMNGIAMTGVADCWIKNVRISNCDSGIFVGGYFCTVDGLLLDAERKTFKGDTGHYGVTLGQDCLIQKFDLQAKFIHDFTMSNRLSGNVVKNGKGKNLSFDYHKKAPYENLFCNIDVGEGSQIWRCGGGRNIGKHCAARGTFWCIQSKKEIKWPSSDFGPDSINVIGVKTSSKPVKDLNGKWLENIPPDELYPKDLHAAQLQLRLRKGSKLRSK